MKKIKAFWVSLDDVAEIPKRELFLGLTTCTLAGILLGMIFTPKKTVTIGSNNSGNGCSNTAGLMDGSECQDTDE